MKEQVELLTDRINDLETHLVDLQATITRLKSKPNSKNKATFKAILILLPLTLVLLALMGLNINYKTNNHDISYNNDGLIEIGLGVITLIAGAYSLKKNNE